MELVEEGNDTSATRFRWEIFLLAGDPEAGGLLTALEDRELGADNTYFGGYAVPEDLAVLAAPDNLTFDGDGNLWITTDGDQPRGHNDGCYVCPTEGAGRGVARQFMSGPVGCEVCGCEITADGRHLFLSIQHPGEGGTAERPISSWPDGGEAAPRPSVVVVGREGSNGKLVG